MTQLELLKAVYDLSENDIKRLKEGIRCRNDPALCDCEDEDKNGRCRKFERRAHDNRE